MSGALKIYLLVAVVVMVVVLAVGPLRALVGGIFSTIVTPSLVAFMTSALRWIWGIVKGIFRAHTMLLMHLIKPHKVIYPTLRRRDDRRL